ncbi:MAG: ankyrin repeat domain-containing protein [Deltaproteobacteria bacterium]|jgi:hypothetical protein|nr:ankyrin repeat domain-containing protein [Deltaproteobacteria bacterium]
MLSLPKFKLLACLLIVTFSFLGFWSENVSAADVYQRQMDAAMKNNDLATMREMLRKGAFIPDPTTYQLATNLKLPTVKFLLDNDAEANGPEVFHDLLTYHPKDINERMNLFFSKNLFPFNNANAAVAIIKDLTKIVSGYATNERNGSKKPEVPLTIGAYKLFLNKTKQFISTYNPAYDLYNTPLMKHIINTFGAGKNINECIYIHSDLFRTYQTNLGSLRYTPLQRAARTGNLDMVRFFISKKADLNKVCTGNTALDYIQTADSSDKNYMDAEMALINAGAKNAR